MYLYGSIEQMGTGTEMILKLCKKQGLAIPEFQQSGDFGLTFWRKLAVEESGVKDGENVTEKGTEKVTNNQQIILDSILKNPHITSDELSAIVGIRADKIRINLSKLKSKGLIERIGPDKGGYWKIISKAP